MYKSQNTVARLCSLLWRCTMKNQKKKKKKKTKQLNDGIASSTCRIHSVGIWDKTDILFNSLSLRVRILWSFIMVSEFIDHPVLELNKFWIMFPLKHLNYQAVLHIIFKETIRLSR